MKREGYKKIFGIISVTALITFMFVSSSNSQVFDFQWGATGGGSGQFNLPVGIAIDSLGNVFVVDAGNSRVQKFDLNGIHVTSWGTNGSGDGQFISPQGIGIDSTNSVYVADLSNNRVQKFNNNGDFVTKWGNPGITPHGIAVDSLDNIYVTDFMNDRVQKFNSSGIFITAWGTTGSANGQFNSPRAIAVDASDRVYVSDANNRIQIFDTAGTYLGTWGASGRGDGQLIDAMGIAFDAGGNLYVSEFGNNRVQKLNNSGNYLTKWGIFGFTEVRFDWPYGVAVNNVGDVYVVDSRNNRIQVFTQPLPATYDASGTWTSSFTNKQVTDQNGFICTPEADSTGSSTLTQNGQFVSATIQGLSYSGFVSGATYNLSRAELIAANTILTEEVIVTLTSATAGSGNFYTAATNNAGAYCLADGVIALTKPTTDGGGGSGSGGGGGGGSCFIGTILP